MAEQSRFEQAIQLASPRARSLLAALVVTGLAACRSGDVQDTPPQIVVSAGGTWERPETGLLRGIEDRLGDLVNLLGSRRYFYADQPSMADLAVYGMLFVLRMDAMTGSARLLASRPTLLEFMRRLEEATGG